MSVSTTQESLLTTGFSLLKRSGLLETDFFSGFFQSAYFVYKRFLEDNLEGFLSARPGLLKVGNVIDVGANIGYTSAVLARAAGAGSQIFSFEPEPFNYRLLCRVARRPESEGKIATFPFAVGAGNGNVDLWLNERHHADHRIITEQFQTSRPAGALSVPLVSIDRFLDTHPGAISFVKIDVQGYELPVCEGMVETIEKNPGINILLEYCPSAMQSLGFDPAHLIRFLEDRKFYIYELQKKGALASWSPAQTTGSGYVDLLCCRQPN